MRWIGAVALLTTMAFSAGCTNSKQSATTSPSVPPTDGAGEPATPGMSQEDAEAMLASFAFDDGASQLALFDNRSDAALVDAAVGALTDGVTGDPLWAATFVCVNECSDPTPLLALIGDGDVSIRIMAATGLVARGRHEGYAPLIDALVDDTPLRGVEPPTAAWAAATQSLVRFTGLGELGPPLDATPAQRRAAQDRWHAWLDADEDTFAFDAEAAYEDVIDGLDLISLPSRPQPLAGDMEIALGSYEHAGSCDEVRAIYQSLEAPVPPGAVVTINGSGNLEVAAQFGVAGVVLAPSTVGGCMYEVLATPSLVVAGAGVHEVVSFSNVWCTSLLGSDLIAADYQADGGAYFVYAFRTDTPEMWGVVLGPGTVAGVLQNSDSVSESEVTMFTTTLTLDGAQHHVFDGAGPAGPVHVELVCTPHEES